MDGDIGSTSTATVRISVRILERIEIVQVKDEPIAESQNGGTQFTTVKYTLASGQVVYILEPK